jgi:hypothetical protein
MSNRATFKNSTVAGDVVQGDKNVLQAPLLPLEKAIQSIIDSTEDNHELEEIIEELAEYITDRPDREIIGVEQKLINGGRGDLLKDAVYLKNKFERTIAKEQMSLVTQRVYAHVLAMIGSSFNHNVRPLILENKSKSEVDQAIHKEIIEPVYQSIVGFNQQITTDLVVGMLYFLTGKCHLIWSEE